jgi:hypothetical protein
MEDNNSSFIKITGLWKNKTKDGQTFLAGNLNGITQLSVMPNKYKKTERDPDYYVYVRPSKKKGEAQVQMAQDDL